jgi:hypothetical protein
VGADERGQRAGATSLGGAGEGGCERGRQAGAASGGGKRGQRAGAVPRRARAKSLVGGSGFEGLGLEAGINRRAALREQTCIRQVYILAPARQLACKGNTCTAGDRNYRRKAFGEQGWRAWAARRGGE